MVALLAPAPNSSLMAGLRARLNNCCAIVSNIQPMLATLSTNQWYPVNSRHHAYFCPPAPSTVGDMKLLFYIAAATRSPTFSGVSQGSATPLGQRIQLIGVYRRSSAAKPEASPNTKALKNNSLAADQRRSTPILAGTAGLGFQISLLSCAQVGRQAVNRADEIGNGIHRRRLTP